MKFRLGEFYSGKRVLITGHTGFKGSWLSEWLQLLGAEITGLSLEPDPSVDPTFTTPYALFNELNLAARITSHIEGDICDADVVRRAVSESDPEIVFHLAAQPLVLDSYNDPYRTFETNVRGTLNLLEAIRERGKPCIAVVVTTDKVYKNREWVYAYRENDRLGGADPYSASKACAELLVSSYRSSFFQPHIHKKGIAVSTARGGNVIGGGDWSKDRIVPDIMRSLASDDAVKVRNRNAIRPWQHVLELLNGYLALAARMYVRREDASSGDELEAVCSSFNFGPGPDAHKTVGLLVDEVFKHWSGKMLDARVEGAPKEAGRLALAADKAHHILGWMPQFDFAEAVRLTVEWYRAFYDGAGGDSDAVIGMTRTQIEQFLLRLDSGE